MDIRIENLSKSYGLQKAVDNISFEVKSGEIVGLLGPNGAGKTTTMKMITQYLAPESGKIWIGNKQNIDPSIRKNVGYLPEHNPLYEEMMVPDYLGFCASLQGVESNKINSRIREMIKVYEFEKVEAAEKDIVVKKLAVLNLERNKCIDAIDRQFQSMVTGKNQA